jgi:hypothetical protein
MIKTTSDDPDVGHAAHQALELVQHILATLPKASTFDYGGHELKIGEYEVCSTCTAAIAEAQQASSALQAKAEETEDPVIKEHLELAAQLFKLEAETAIIRAEFHNGVDTEPILNAILGFQYDRSIHDDYHHNHEAGK